MAKSRTTKAAILKQVPAALARAKEARLAGRRAVSAHYDEKASRVMLELTSGVVFGFPPTAIPALATASPDQLARVQLSPGGSGLHWEELDVDLSVAGLLLSSIDHRDRQL